MGERSETGSWFRESLPAPPVHFTLSSQNLLPLPGAARLPNPDQIFALALDARGWGVRAVGCLGPGNLPCAARHPHGVSNNPKGEVVSAAGTRDACGTPVGAPNVSAPRGPGGGGATLTHSRGLAGSSVPREQQDEDGARAVCRATRGRDPASRARVRPGGVDGGRALARVWGLRGHRLGDPPCGSPTRCLAPGRPREGTPRGR